MSIKIKNSHIAIFIGSFLLAVFINGIAFQNYGVRYGGDTRRYTKARDLILNGGDVKGKSRGYMSYHVYLAIIKSFSLSEKWAIWGQIFFHWIAAVCLFLLATEIGNELSGVAAALLFMFNWDMVQWNMYVYTDSLYISFIIISTFLLTTSYRNRSFSHLFLAILVTTFTVFLRPSGWVMLPVMFFVLAFWSRSKRIRYGILTITLAGFLLSLWGLNFFDEGIKREYLLDHIEQGTIIWGYEDWHIAMPSGENLESSGLEGILLYVLKNPLACTKLFTFRIATGILHARPFYSLTHNIYAALLSACLCIFGIIGIVKFWNNPTIKMITLTVVFHTLLIGVTFANWDGRFFLYPMALLIAPAMACVTNLIDRFRRKGEKTPLLNH